MTPALDAGALARFSSEISEGRPVGVAVSGGGDSLALLLMLAEILGSESLRAATVDHCLRPESAAEAESVARLCKERGIAHDALRWTGWDGRGNLQHEARSARYRLLANWAVKRGSSAVALGHTRDDDAETFAMGLARGAGIDGLSGMRPAFARGPVAFLRPLLGVARAALREYLIERNVVWIDDPSNEDPRFERVRVRKALETLADAGVAPDRLVRSIANLRDLRTAINEHIAAWSCAHVRQRSGDLLVDSEALAALPRDFARRALSAALRWVSGTDVSPRAEAVIRALETERPAALTLHGCLVTFREDVRVSREPAAAARARPVAPGDIWDGRWRLIGAERGEVRALSEEGLLRCPSWREAGLPRPSLAASPSLWDGGRLIAAPLANLADGHRAELAGSRADFAESFLSR